MSTDHRAAGSVASPGATSVFSFQARAGQRVAFDIAPADANSLNGRVELYASDGSPLAAGTHPLGANGVKSPDTSLHYTFAGGGTYYLGISGPGGRSRGNTGGFVLYSAVTGGSGFSGLQFTATRPGGLSSPVTITRFDGSTAAIDPSVRTWVLIHGYKGNGHTSGISRLANEIHAQYPSDQVLTLDWSTAAADPSYADTEQWLPAVGVAAGQSLAFHGFAPATVNLIGYSFGTYIADQIAAHLPGGANTIAAIDPPEYIPDGPGTFNPEASVNFRVHARFSWAIHDADAGTSLGDAITPTTAHESIAVTGTSHGGILALFDALVVNGDTVSAQFHLSRLLAYGPGPWAINRYNYKGQAAPGGYEALLTTTGGGTAPLALSYFSSANGNLVTLNA